MKRAKNLFEKIVNIDNLQYASTCASLHKRKRKNVKRFFENKAEKLNLLQDLLVKGQYKPLPYTRKSISDRCSGKIREIFIPKFFPDQIAQWALMLILKPYILKGMYDYCCASIEGRGGSYGMRAVKRWLKEDSKQTKYCLVIDIKKFYPNIDQDLLLQKFHKILKDQKTLDLIEVIVRSVPSGVPIGNYTSQWFANFFLQDFDHYVKEQLKIPHYIRYMDDMVFFSGNKRKLGKWRVQINDFLTKEKLTIKPNWQIFKIGKNKDDGRPLDFLGYKFYRDYVTMRSKTFLRATRRIRKIAKKERLIAKDSSAIMSYTARIKVTSGNRFFLKYVSPYVNVGNCRKVISRHDRMKALERQRAEEKAVKTAVKEDMNNDKK